ncbi:unnamed protein product [Clonostachys rhizophaga]|uniref:Major facilitator superfamily (MFS) profile domain-containing protein n=1 Tax=Clonostachys rhizophaga TaxID=160324 RepID=A0A9N9VUD7_9HYPO|nr:unnamed protein product [Clonostachys rhizophaga]
MFRVRGLLTSWYPVTVSASLFVANFTVYGIYMHVPNSRLRYQISWFGPASSELSEIEHDISWSQTEDRASFRSLTKETFTKATNLRCLQQLNSPAGANSITSYLVTIMKMVGQGGISTADNKFLSGMYSFAKLWFTLIEGPVLDAAVQGAIAMLFIYEFRYTVGLLILPYVFGSELWPNQIRSFGTVLGSSFYWIFVYAVKYSMPVMLTNFHNWGGFIFFAGWVFIIFVYVFFMVPEVAGMTVEEIEGVFEGPWFIAYKRNPKVLEGSVSNDQDDDFKHNINKNDSNHGAAVRQV